MTDHTPARSENTGGQRPYTYLGHVETGIYVLLGILMSATALLAIMGVLHLFGDGIRDWTGTTIIFELIDRLLLILMLVELLHTVRISIRSHVLVVEPFLIIGLIALIRRTLVLALQTESFTNNQPWSTDIAAHFRASMIELGLLALLIVVFIASIYAIRKRPSEEEAAAES